jgi:hypothetical protein
MAPIGVWIDGDNNVDEIFLEFPLASGDFFCNYIGED